MDTVQAITHILCDILDLEPDRISTETYVIRDLGAESIDLLEIGVAMEQQFHIPVNDDRLFLKSLRVVLARAEASGSAPLDALRGAYPHLSTDRLSTILEDLTDGPVLKVRDLAAYVVQAAHSASK